jgi:phosphatidylserine/phosphatidylglycerophosphate/cardiolipin synthase-like enzyme
MPAFRRPFDPSLVAVTTVEAALPDRRGDAGPTRFARYPRLPIRFLVATPAPGPLELSWPTAGAVRLVELPSAAAAALGVNELVELSPLPFVASSVFRALGPGLPTFYLGYVGAPLPEHDSAVRADDPPMTVTRAVLGCVFQDRMTLEPWAWVDLIGDALGAALPAEAAGWRTLAALFDGGRTLQVRDAAGRPATNEVFDLRFLDASSAVLRQATMVSDAAGALGPQALPASGEARVEIAWRAAPGAGDEALPVLALYEPSLARPDDDSTRSYPGAPLVSLAATARGAHLQLLDLARWYSPQALSPGHPWPARFRPRSRVEPLVDGLATYTRLVADMRRASGIHLAGWAFFDFPMRPYDPGSSLLNLMDSIGRDRFRVLVVQSFLPKVGAIDTLGTDALVTLFMAMCAAQPLIATRTLGAFNDWGMLTWTAATVATMVALVLADVDTAVEAKLREAAEFTKEPMRRALYEVSDDPAAGRPPCAFPAAHPVTIPDNPIANDFDLPGFGPLSGVQAHFGTFHQKVQVLAIPSGTGSAYVGYLGGIDINSNRVDGPGHHASRPRGPETLGPPHVEPYHDVHARVTGPAVLDVVGLFHERYRLALDAPPTGVVQDPLYQPPATPPPPAFEPPADVPAPAGQHLVQIAQTSFEPGPGGTGLPWASQGAAPIRETFERAIRNAREYIYIEDQYFTLDNGLVALLRAAADHCRRLVITIPASTPDQVFGDQRRLATFERLSGATGGVGGWGDRMVVGTPFRRSVLPPAERFASIGRGNLTDEVVSATASKIYVGPPPRVPPTVPYFFWVAGELMYATDAKPVTSPGGHPAVELDVLRGSHQGTQTPWCPHPRPHKAGAPVTFSAPRGIFVHAKLLMVDDLFVAIGSANWNRRGFFHDGEVDAFAIPDRLRASRENPALLLRTALWAEHLGLTPFMGRSVLADPIEAFELFRRSRYQGNRYTDYREFTAPRGDLAALNTAAIFELIPEPVKITVIATANAFVLSRMRDAWNTIFDPTTSVELNPTEGPELP